MKLKVFAIFDSAVQAYLQPFFMQSSGAAIRAVIDTASHQDSQWNRHKADFTLFELAEYDDTLGTFSNLHTPQNLGTILSLMPPAPTGPHVLGPQSTVGENAH